MNLRKILVVDDKIPTISLLKRTLEKNGYEVYTATRGREALEIVAQQRIDLVLLDLKLPDIGGIQVCQAMRKEHPSLPIIIISVKSDERDKVQALNMCADDYVSKPFYMSEVLARIRVQLLHASRMQAGAQKHSLIVGPLNIDFEQRRVKINEQEIDLTYTEYELLYILFKNRGRIVTYDLILDEIWEDDDTSERQNIHTYVNRLRKKIEAPAARRFIYNEAKVGYRFQADD